MKLIWPRFSQNHPVCHEILSIPFRLGWRATTARRGTGGCGFSEDDFCVDAGQARQVNPGGHHPGPGVPLTKLFTPEEAGALLNSEIIRHSRNADGRHGTDPHFVKVGKSDQISPAQIAGAFN